MAIRVRGARQNNLKGFDVDIPHGALTVITGVSGSGKSSLAFQTLYAEGQRRYSESFSAYVRQFLDRLPRPRVDSIEGMLPAIAIEQTSGMGGGRSTVATMTDLADYLKLLFARAGVLHCPSCGGAVPEASAPALRDLILREQGGRLALIAFPVTLAQGVEGDAEAERYRQLGELRTLGFGRHLWSPGWDGEVGPLAVEPRVGELDASALGVAAEASGARLWILVDRLRLEPSRAERLLEAVEQALHHGDGPLALLVEEETPREGLKSRPRTEALDSSRSQTAVTWTVHRHALGLRCQPCDRVFEQPTPNLFSYNTPVGACEPCSGFGRVMAIDWDLVIPDPRKSLAQGAIRPWTTPKTAWEREHLEALCEAAGIPMDVPWKDLGEEARRLVMEGDEDGEIWGVKGWFDWLETRTYRTHVRIFLARYRAYRPCPACGGSRLKPEALAYRVGGLDLGEIYRMDVAQARRFFDSLRLPDEKQSALGPVLGEICSRLRYLEEVGVEYLTLDRPARTLSGGESQRVTLTTALGASLVQTLFVLDEPTVGLHPRDTHRLVGILGRLTEGGNTVVVVEHDPELIAAADHLVDLGPGAGEAGGELLYCGPPRALLEAEARRHESAAAPAPNASQVVPRSRTAELLLRPGRVLHEPPPRRPNGGASLMIRGATAHNLAGIDVSIPLGSLVCITGVSGSGKSTLVEHVLHRGLARRLGRPKEAPGAHRAMEGWEALADVIYVDQSPAAASPRATPLTYMGVFDHIRRLYAATPEAQLRDFRPGTFSWNVAGGRCEACEGMGSLRVELHFLPDAHVPCEVCEGRRFTPEVLAVTWRGLSLHDLLSLTVNEALEFFDPAPYPSSGVLSESFADGRSRGKPARGARKRGEARPASPAEGGREGPPLNGYRVPKVVLGLKVLKEVGLGYLRLGQGLHTLSGGEAQRLKVARHLAQEKTTGSLFLLDEPTRGLHLSDVGVLIEALHRLVERGNTVVVVEHHLEVIWQADHVIDLGPEGGAGGGSLVCAGPPEALCAQHDSHTGRFLAAYLSNEVSPLPANGSLPGVGATRLGGEAQGFVPATDATRAAEKGDYDLSTHIQLRGAREHNLADLDLDIPRDKLVVLTGSSGSGKSSVAFDILHAEGQRRFMDCLSPYARQYMHQLSRPDIASVRGLPPTIAVEQRLTAGRQMSTVSTVTEIFPYLRLLFAKVGRQRCPDCGALATTATSEELLAEVLGRYAGHRVRILAPVIRQRKGWHNTVLDRARKMGLSEVRVDGALRPLVGKGSPTRLARYRLHDVDFVLCHQEVSADLDGRWRELLAQALELGRGSFSVLTDSSLAASGSAVEDLLGTARMCRGCKRAFAPPDPRLFSFTSPQGACPSCAGTGRSEDGALCPTCQGSRLSSAALSVELGGLSLSSVHGMRPKEARAHLGSLELRGHLGPVVEPLRQEILTRLGFLETVGLSYLTLDRSAASLSGGEHQRLRLAAHLSAPLHGVLYILDEPTIGLHPEDHAQLLAVLGNLRRVGNTVLIVEHDEETMRAADHLIDLGPGGGREGGRLVDQGSPAAVQARGTGLTARLLRGEIDGVPDPAEGGLGGREPRTFKEWILLEGVHAQNLKDVAVRLPTGALSVITGRSGSGKSTLLQEVILASSREGKPQGCSQIVGLDAFHRVVEVDQRPIGRNPRSCPATYVGLMARLRERFAQLPEARLRGFGPGRFSFNVEGGRCPECQGHGWLTVEMGFLPDAHVPCPRCGGQRYHKDTLAIRLLGRSIADVLAMTASEAAVLLGGDPRLARPLSLFVEIGLGYLPLGQPSPSLSGGEAQRIKLVEELSKSARQASLFLLDEPTTGLHGADVQKLVGVLYRLVDAGHTVVVIEHHLGVMAAADWIVDLGPGAGPEGGHVLYQGPPGPLAADPHLAPQSATATWLARASRAKRSSRGMPPRPAK